MTLHVEMDYLASLGSTLQELAIEAVILQTGSSAGPWFTGPGGVEPAVLEAASIANDLVDTALVNTVRERLSETGEIMVNVANQFRNADEEASEVATAIYTDATGDWVVPEVPQ
jgi:hypothetical protein